MDMSLFDTFLSYINLYGSDVIYGGIDGIITTFSIVAGSIGGDLARNVVLILGISNVVSDGYSMGISSYISTQTELKQGLIKEKNALVSGIITFLSFILIGVIPILPFLTKIATKNARLISLVLAFMTFFIIGNMKGLLVKENMLYYGLQTLLIGSTAAVISYSIGKLIGDMNGS